MCTWKTVNFPLITATQSFFKINMMWNRRSNFKNILTGLYAFHPNLSSTNFDNRCSMTGHKAVVHLWHYSLRFAICSIAFTRIPSRQDVIGINLSSTIQELKLSATFEEYSPYLLPWKNKSAQCSKGLSLRKFSATAPPISLNFNI